MMHRLLEHVNLKVPYQRNGIWSTCFHVFRHNLAIQKKHIYNIKQGVIAVENKVKLYLCITSL